MVLRDFCSSSKGELEEEWLLSAVGGGVVTDSAAEPQSVEVLDNVESSSNTSESFGSSLHTCTWMGTV